MRGSQPVQGQGEGHLVAYRGHFAANLSGHRNIVEVAMTIRLFLVTLAVLLARALLAHGCAEVFRLIMVRFVPSVQPLIGAIIALILGVILIEVIVLWRGGRTP
jgi:hypothetical protein